MTIKILLVDDNQYFLAAVKQFLDMLPGAEVVAEAHNGFDALSKAAEWEPDLILLDIAMPEMNGLEVARCLIQWPQSPRIVFLSIHDGAAYREVARELGAEGFVCKADFVADLLPIIGRLVDARNPT
ncbi:MAG: response regulator transcription factor [Rhodoferax sp.]|uniref:response regulator transcription factor n=1 Tax=Rhodoferax sp. TaxID=50421 RepID=UPI00301B67D5